MKICPKCSVEHSKQGTFCSRKCANGHVQSHETNIKRAQTLRKTLSERPRLYQKREPPERFCIRCGTSFRSYIRKTCSEECLSMFRSLTRQKIITNKKWENRRTTFSYKEFSIECDSKLEEAAVIYIVDNFKCSSLSRFVNLINYREGNKHRTFNPDFWAILSNTPTIIEVKMKWKENSQNHYGRTIPLKKEALQDFCSNRGLGFMWLDTSNKQFVEVYRKHLRACLARTS